MKFAASLLMLKIAAVICLSLAHTADQDVYVMLNHEGQVGLPLKFRIASCGASGSAQFSAETLPQMLQAIPDEKVVIVDLREEPHGFAGGTAVSWYGEHNWLNRGKGLKEIAVDEKIRLEALQKRGISVVHRRYKEKTIRFEPTVRVTTQAMTEEELAKRHGVGYYRLPVTDHLRPSDKAVDAFVAFVKGLPQDTWLHFHCFAGKGRTTTFLTMYDMMKSAKNEDIAKIIKRQRSLGGTNLMEIPDMEHWRGPGIEERSRFIQDFYRYCRENASFSISWSEWVNHQKRIAETRSS